MYRALLTITLLCVAPEVKGMMVGYEKWVHELLNAERAVKQFRTKNSRLPHPTEYEEHIAPVAPHVRYEVEDDAEFSLIHAGADAQFGTEDDHDIVEARQGKRQGHDRLKAWERTHAMGIARPGVVTACCIVLGGFVLLLCVLVYVHLMHFVFNRPDPESGHR